MERHWAEVLGDGFKPIGRWQLVTVTSELPELPVATEMALRFGMLIPIFGVVATVVAVATLRKPEHAYRLLVSLLAVTVVSLLLTAHYCFGIAWPPLNITYGLSP